MQPKFLTNLDVSLVEETANTWRLDAPLVFYSAWLHITLTVPQYFVTDFASVPRLPLAYLLCGDVGRAASALHDYLYRNGIFDRRTCDRVFREALVASGVAGWRAGLMYAGVRACGWIFYRKGV